MKNVSHTCLITVDRECIVAAVCLHDISCGTCQTNSVTYLDNCNVVEQWCMVTHRMANRKSYCLALFLVHWL